MVRFEQWKTLLADGSPLEGIRDLRWNEPSDQEWNVIRKRGAG